MVVGDRTDALELIANSACVRLVSQPGLDAGHSAPRLGVAHLGVRDDDDDDDDDDDGDDDDGG